MPLNIFFIDDDEINNYVFKKLVSKLSTPLNISFFKGGAEALERLVAINHSEDLRYPDFIFVDINMPGMTGWEFLNEYQLMNLHNIAATKILISTSSVFAHEKERAHAHPLVQHFICKPFDFEFLRDTLHK